LEGVVVWEVIGDVITGWLGDRWLDPRADRLLPKGELGCGLRVIAGDAPGVTNKWSHGNALVAPGKVGIQGNTIRVLAISRTHQRSPGGWEILKVNPSCQIVEIKTAGAVLEWAVLDRHLAWAVDRVQSTPDVSA
jgi:hypothetical protein